MRNEIFKRGNLSLRIWNPARSGPSVVIALHGMISHSGWFSQLGRHLNDRGITLMAPDRLGSGETQAHFDPEHSAEDYVHDLHEVIQFAKTRFDRVVLLGWCWGARLAIIAASEISKVERLVLITPNLATHRDVKAKNVQAQSAEGDQLNLPFNARSFSDNIQVCEWIEQDPLRWRYQPRSFVEVSRALLEKALEGVPKLKIPVQSVFATVDHLIDNEEVKLILGEREGVTVLEGGHALILERPGEIADRVAEWLVT